MRANGWRGATRARKVRTTVADPAATRAPDLVNRQFHAAAPGLLHVADFTYVPLAGGGFGYTALVIDAYAGPDPRLGMQKPQPPQDDHVNGVPVPGTVRFATLVVRTVMPKSFAPR
jgi:transposase InsO family protein